jgi:hypothetical protein
MRCNSAIDGVPKERGGKGDRSKKEWELTRGRFERGK